MIEVCICGRLMNDGHSHAELADLFGANVKKDPLERLRACLRFDAPNPLESEMEAAAREVIAEVEHMRRDVERYLWVRRNLVTVNAVSDAAVDDAVDKAIDSAIKEGRHGIG